MDRELRYKSMLSAMDENISDDDEKPACFICKLSDATVTLFKQETLDKCKHSLQIRQVCKLKYCEVSLTNETDNKSGYHSQFEINLTNLFP